MTTYSSQFVNYLLQQLFTDPATQLRAPAPIKRHTDNLTKGGDFSFPVDVQSWRYALAQPPPDWAGSIFDLRCPVVPNAPDGVNQSVTEAAEKLLPQLRPFAQQVLVQSNRIVVHLDRAEAFAKWRDNGTMEPSSAGCKVLVKSAATGQSITDHRCEMLGRVLRNLLAAHSRYELVADEQAEADVCVMVSHKSTEKSLEAPDVGTEMRTVICGVVRESGANKMSGMLAEEYLRRRQKHMELMAQHKYGLRVPDAATFAGLSARLGAAAVTVDLLEVKHSSPVTLAAREQHSGGGASRGAAFILYNSARIEKLVSTYESHLRTGYYEPAAAYDWRLLREDEEWQLWFNYVLEFPALVGRALGGVELSGSAEGRRQQQQPRSLVVAPHLICAFLSGLAKCFSVYYSRVRILDHNRKHLLPTLQCRMRLVQEVRRVMNCALALLDIQPMEKM